MILISVNGVRKHYGPDPVLDGVTFDVRPGERVSLVGPNGAGKTTLMNILAGRDDPDAGVFARHPSSTLGYLEQHPEFAAGRTVWQEASDALSDLVSLSRQAEQVAQAIGEATDDDERRRLGERFDHLQHELQHRDAYNLNHQIEQVLQGLGFRETSYQQPVETLSGGQKNRLLLVKLLLSEPDLMLLDEPSNHLDIEATEWLENFLIASQQTLIVVSHDRYFLDKVTNRTLELFRGVVEAYPGNFSAYVRQKAERLEVQRRTYEKQQEEISRMEEFVRKNFAGQKSNQAEDRRKKLERIERVDPPREIVAPAMAFPSASRTGDIVLRVERLSKSFTRPLFQDVTFDVLRGEKWGVLGPNGCGKTTMLRCILGDVPRDGGNVSLGAGVKAGYFDQMLSRLDLDQPVAEAIRPTHKEFNTQQRRDLLARFGVTGDMAFQKIGSLSGGERNRAALAWLAASDANFLVLDEPTNHLDLWARGSLEKALREFDGSVLLVSHDRYFLNQVCDHLLVVEPTRFRVIEGNYDTYLHLAKQGLVGAATAAPAAREKEKAAAAAARAKTDKPKRTRKFPYRKVEQIEAEIADRERQVEELHALIAQGDVLRDGARAKAINVELETQQQAIARLYEHWEEASELN